MKNYEDLVKLLNMVEATGGLDCDEKSVCDYQDMIGHSTPDQLRELANGTTRRALYRVYGVAYGTINAIEFYIKNNEKIFTLMQERDNAIIDLEEANEKIEKIKKENGTLIMTNGSIERQLDEANEKLKKQEAEIMELKAHLYDLMIKK